MLLSSLRTIHSIQIRRRSRELGHVSQNLSIATATPTIFSCPKCGETIDVSATSCRFCSEPINADFARHAAEVLAKINQACSDATYMRTTALALPVFAVLRYIPFASMLGGVGWGGLLFIVPIWAVRWWLRFSDIETQDPDYIKSRKAVKIIGLVVGGLLALNLLVFLAAFAFGFMKALSQR